MREIDQNEDALSSVYKNSRVAIIFIHFVLVAAAFFYSEWVAQEYLNVLHGSARETLINLSHMMVWTSSIIILHTFIYDRKSFYLCWLVAPCWYVLVDSLGITFWMGTTALLLSLLTQFRPLLLGMLIPWAISLKGYLEFYDPASHLVFYAVFVVLILASLCGLRKVEHQEAAAEVTARKIEDEEALKEQQRFRNAAATQASKHAVEQQEGTTLFRPPADDVDIEKPKTEPKPVPPVSRGYRPPRDELEPAIEVITPKSPPVKKVFRPAKDDYAGILLMLEKIKSLPAALQDELSGVIKNARMILTSMEEDPEDVIPGNAFLSRYIPALESVVTQIQKLSASEMANKANEQAMDKCFHALQALRSAFAQQYEQLQENNQLKFNVEMDMLDSLLKTDGFK